MPRILKFMAHAPKEYPIYFSKYDISDGFWRMVVAAGAEWNFAYVLPQKSGEPTRLVVPNALQMGWKESPGYFCSASETARDAASELAGFMHIFEEHIKVPEPKPTTDKGPIPWAAIEVFVDDFIAMSQDMSRMAHLTRLILHGVEEVFPDQSVMGHKNGRHPMSEKKLLKGDADWEMRKEVLGWLVDGGLRTLEPPADKAAAYMAELTKMSRKARIPIKRFREIVGKLQFASICLPAGQAFMTALNMALKGDPKFVRNTKGSEVHESLGDWKQLIKELASRPTNVNEIIATLIDYYGYCDACNTGAGGVWLPLDTMLDAFIWRVPWPPDIIKKLQVYDGLYISDAESAGVLLQQMGLEVEVADLRHKKAVSFCDNTPAVSWVTCMASNQSQIGGRLVKGMAVRVRSREMCLPQTLSVPGEANEMADVSLRSFNANSGYLFNDDKLLTHFETHFPLPQNRSWKIVTLPPEDVSKVLSTLRGQRLTMAQWTSPGVGNTGKTGLASANCGKSPHTSLTATGSNKLGSSGPLLTGSDKETLDAAAESLRSRAVGQTIQLAGYDDPTKVYGGRERIIQLRRMLESYRREDPPPKPQLAVPISVIEKLQEEATARGGTTKANAIADLATIAFFFLLRLGEYTMPALNRVTRTVQFRLSDVRFWRQGILIPNNSHIAILMQADGVSLCIDNQKNGTRGETVHQHALPGNIVCPVEALARRVATIWAATRSFDEPISCFATADAPSQHATAALIRRAVRHSVSSLGLYRQGIRAASVGFHSLRAGGAMAIKLNGCDLISIMKAGRWTSLTFLTYIHNQIAHLGANITQRMAHAVPFYSF
ncbi:hypothetical protein ACHAXR_012341 [Thalassiosira sp. AJA248-18]